MRVRMLRNMVVQNGLMNISVGPGQVLDVKEERALSWIKSGIAMEDKSVDGPPKAKTPDREPKDGEFWCSKCETYHRINSKIGERHKRHG
jgi:hypothetical protein